MKECGWGLVCVEREIVCVERERVCVCVCVCGERERECAGVEREKVCVCVEREREREREREKVCVGREGGGVKWVGGERKCVCGAYKLYNYVQLFVLPNDPDCNDSDKYVIIVHCYCCYCLYQILKFTQTKVIPNSTSESEKVYIYI